MPIYLAPWEWVSVVEAGGVIEQWQSPFATTRGVIDLRTLPAMGTAGGTPQGLGLFHTRNAEPTVPGAILLADNPQLNPNKATIVQELGLGEAIVADRMDEIIYELLTMQAEPEGLNRWRPLMPTHTRRMKIRLGGIIQDRPYNKNAAEASVILANLQHDYRTVLAETIGGLRNGLNGKPDPNHHRKMLGAWERKYGFNAEEMIPSDLPSVTPLPPTSSFTDDFSGADNVTDVDGTFGVSGGTCNKTGTASGNIAVGRHTTALSTDDQLVEDDFTAQGTNYAFFGPCSRFASSAATTYWFLSRNQGNLRQIGKLITGTATDLGNDSSGSGPPNHCKIIVDGSDITSEDDAGAGPSNTDTAITGNTNVGVTAHRTAVTTSSGDNLHAEDYVALTGGRKNPLGYPIMGALGGSIG